MMRQPLRPRRWEKYLFTLILVPCLMLPIADTQENEVTDAQPQPPAKKLEEAVITDMLRIVDHKFDTLTTRITALERAVSSLQFFSIRQFRQIGGSLQTTQNDLEKISKQVGQLEVDQRGLKIAMSLLGRDVSEVKKNSDQLLEQLESNVAYIYENIDKQETFMKVLVEDTVLGSTREMTGLLAKQLDEVAADLKSQLGNTECADCTVNFTEISQHFDSAVAGYQHETQAHFDEIINSTMQEIMAVRLSDRGKMCVNDECQKDESIETEDDQDKTRSSLEESSIEQEHSEKSTTSSGAGSPTQSAQSDSARATEPLSESSVYRDENDERVMRALYNMTDSVLQAVSYFRNTGQMLENILSNTDMMISQQAAFTHKLNVLHLGQLVQGDAGSGPDHSNEIPIMDRENKEALLRSLQRDFKGCNLHVDLANSMATMIKNGSQLLEVLTDLAQMSSGSLTQATAALQDEITRVEGVRTRMATTLLAAGDESSPVAQLTNTTQRTFKLMEAVASNTGWLPLIYKNVQHVESLTNRSLHLTTRNEVMLRQVRQMAIANREEKKERPETPLSNRISHLPTSDETPSEFSALNRESLETIYSTSLQLNRIMPALTKLLAEPDPLITLVGGGRPDQGRIEIYHKGQWGAFCHRELTHQEADIICRHLGLAGGISAGAGHFGAGGGITWTFNTSCLASSRCSVVGYSEEPCSHEQDVSVICDHMLRIITTEETEHEKLGRIEIYHRGMWLPICGAGWNDYAARVACRQMDFTDGRKLTLNEWSEGSNSTWLGKVACEGIEKRLDACYLEDWENNCPSTIPAGVRCL